MKTKSIFDSEAGCSDDDLFSSSEEDDNNYEIDSFVCDDEEVRYVIFGPRID